MKSGTQSYNNLKEEHPRKKEQLVQDQNKTRERQFGRNMMGEKVNGYKVRFEMSAGHNQSQEFELYSKYDGK